MLHKKYPSINTAREISNHYLDLDDQEQADKAIQDFLESDKTYSELYKGIRHAKAGRNAEARLAKANQPPKPNASVYNSVMGQFYKLQEDPLAALSEAQRLGLVDDSVTTITPATMNLMEQYYDRLARSRASDFSSSASDSEETVLTPPANLIS